MIKIVCITLVIVSNMVVQGRIILQNLGLCNLSIGIRYVLVDLPDFLSYGPASSSEIPNAHPHIFPESILIYGPAHWRDSGT